MTPTRGETTLSTLRRLQYIASRRIPQSRPTPGRSRISGITFQNNPQCEVACLVLLKCDWFPESEVIGVSHFRRTWKNELRWITCESGRNIRDRIVQELSALAQHLCTLYAPLPFWSSSGPRSKPSNFFGIYGAGRGIFLNPFPAASGISKMQCFA
jgi:hypothetical protein